LHFAATAALVGILAGMKIGRRDVLSWVAAGIAAIATQLLVDGAWYMIVGVAAGLAVTLLRGDVDAEQ
jgi:predicted branched-subunit amino acid permease